MLCLCLVVNACCVQDWDDEEDGEWEAPQIDNPKCGTYCREQKDETRRGGFFPVSRFLCHLVFSLLSFFSSLSSPSSPLILSFYPPFFSFHSFSPLSHPPHTAETGCGPWIKPKIRNPLFKGKWHARQIPNPEYKVRE